MDYGDIVADPQLEHKPPDTTQSFRSSRHDYTPEGFPHHFLQFLIKGGVSCPRDKHTAWGRLCGFILSLTFFGALIYLCWWRSDLQAATLVQTASTKQYDLSRPPHNNPNLTRCAMSFLAVLSSFPAIFFMQSVKMNEWMGVSLTIYRQIWALRYRKCLYLFFCFVLRKQPSHVNPTQGVINEAPGG